MITGSALLLFGGRLIPLTTAAWQTWGKTVYGEARGEPFLGQVGVGWVIRNRAAKPGWWGKDIDSVCRAPFQFSCWLEGDPNRRLLDALVTEDPHYRRALSVVGLVASDDLSDPTGGATYYVNLLLAHPEWADRFVKTALIGAHTFFREAE